MILPQALIFDVDGTLAETERDGHRVAFNQAFTEAGLDWDWSIAEYGKLLAISGGKERIHHYWQTAQADTPIPDPPEAFIARLHRHKSEHYHQLLTAGTITLRPGVERLITAARAAGVRLAIATTSALPNAMALLETSLDPAWFEVIAAGDIVPQKKPAPDIYHYVLTELNLPASACLVLEDSAHGLTAATQAGLTTVITANAYTQGQDFTAAALVVNHLGEPDQPLKVIQGEAIAPYFSLDWARQLLVA
ncbi:HAD family hydrolase [Spirulina major]|uniref:HAD family hydrolase n=1 Tax=Spirulina major TaxID=270636 RepID=UPI000933D526|nr:HAD family hydrolase [Spirulina major]